jgi:hypothetical protein
MFLIGTIIALLYLKIVHGNFREIKHPQIKYPWGIAFDPQRNLHVVSNDSSVRGVNIFTPESHHLPTLW